MIHVRKVGRARYALLVAILSLLFQPTAVLAGDCTIDDKHGEERDCTYTEEFAECLYEAEDSWDQCLDNADGLLSKAGCYAGLVVDALACVPDGIL